MDTFCAALMGKGDQGSVPGDHWNPWMTLVLKLDDNRGVAYMQY